MKLTKISVWSTAWVIALLYVILNAILLTVVSLTTNIAGVSQALGEQSLTVPTTAGQWLFYLGTSFVLAFLLTALTVWIYNLLAKVFAINIELKEGKAKRK
ncbi:hypothetical protein COS75_00790 [Candidatus Pacearchaeota archaeon CG06_land_8_20_14_3_00_35_12]|nr:MAG: hypothetical protein COS75_00790 [Candidatus Pacearchaeota archaeon CG06_land_8_20_14_3_00_35_12]